MNEAGWKQRVKWTIGGNIFHIAENFRASKDAPGIHFREEANGAIKLTVTITDEHSRRLEGNSMKHHVERTSPKGPGSPFIGTCRLCGKPGLKASAALEDCENVRGLSADEALIETITGQPAP